MPFVLSVLIACGVFLMVGSLVLRQAPGRLPFTSIVMGQMIVWAAAVVVLPLGAGVDRLIGVSPPIGVWLWGGLAVAVALRWRTITRAGSNADLVLAGVGLAAIVKVALVYSAQSHLGALGLDTHQHIYWTRQLLDAHHVPLVERDTQVLALYPRGFHLLTALWSSAAIAGPVGSWVKLMPFLQAWLPCVALAELVCVGVRRRSLAPLLALALVVYAFAISRMAFPEHDLSGTPRFASGAVFFFPVIALCAGQILERRALRSLAVACLPAVALLLLSLNAILLVQFVVFALPLMAVLAWSGKSGDGLPAAVAIAASLAIAAGVCLQDPWIVAQWAPRFAPGYLDLFGVITPDQAASLGLLSKDELVSQDATAVLYRSIADFARLFFASLAMGMRDFLTAGWRFPFSHDLFSDTGRIALRIVMLGCLGAAFSAAGRKRTPQRTLFFALTIGACAGGFAQLALFHFADGLAIGRGYEFVLLRNYCEVAATHVGLPLQGMILVTGIAWAATSTRGCAARPSLAQTTGVTAVIAALPFVLHGATQSVDPARGFWTPVGSGDIAALRTLESHIEPEQGVLVPAAAWEIGEERWIIPQGPTASVLPFADRRMVFNGRLGPSVFYNWRDVARFCRGSDAERADFLARHNVRWFLLKDDDVASDALHRRFRMCKLPLAKLGVVTPPAYVAGDLALYRIDPARLRGVDD
ncbi:MAG: hypothetical protein GY944_14565 [bacterium]|nr:hypothetical protein [bacterium]